MDETMCESNKTERKSKKKIDLDMPGLFLGDIVEEAAIIRQRQNTNASSRSGYAADCEDAENIFVNKSPGYRNNGKVKRGRCPIIPPHSHSKRRKKEQSMVKIPIEDGSWIQRIYRGTPFSLASIAKNTAQQDDFSFIPRELSDDTVERLDRLKSRSFHKFSSQQGRGGRRLVPFMVNERQTILPFESQDFPWDAPTSSDSSDTNSDGADEEQEEANLLKIVSDMLAESQENQARYRSYSQGDSLKLE